MERERGERLDGIDEERERERDGVRDESLGGMDGGRRVETEGEREFRSDGRMKRGGRRRREFR
jgi:hypothetical protein